MQTDSPQADMTVADMTVQKDITVQLNGNVQQLTANTSLAELLSKINIASDTHGVAVALNEEVIAKDSWAGTELSMGDEVLVITATQGG